MNDRRDFLQFLNRGIFAEKQNKISFAIECYKKLISDYKYEIEGYIYLAKLYMNKVSFNTLDEKYLLTESTLDIYPYKSTTDNIEYFSILADVKFKLKKFEETEDILIKLLNENKNSSFDAVNVDNIYYNMSIIKLHSKNFDLALNYLDKIDDTVQFNDYNLVKGQIYFLKQNNFLALRYLKMHYDNGNINNEYTNYLLSLIYYELDAYDAADLYLSKILKLTDIVRKDFLSDIYILAGDINYKKGNHEDAINFYEKSLEVKPDNSQVKTKIDIIKFLKS